MAFCSSSSSSSSSPTSSSLSCDVDTGSNGYSTGSCLRCSRSCSIGTSTSTSTSTSSAPTTTSSSPTSSSVTSPKSPTAPWLPCFACVQVAHLKLVDGADHLLLSLTIEQDKKTFFRAVDEKLDKLRARLELVVNGPSVVTSLTSRAKKKLKKKQKKVTVATDAKDQENESLPAQDQGKHAETTTNTHSNTHSNTSSKRQHVVFYDRDHQPINCKRPIGEALWDTKYFEIGDTKYCLLKNEPQILSLRLVEPLLHGIPAAPFGETEFCDLDQCEWKWYRVAPGVTSEEASDEDRVCIWTKRIYTPSCEDIGCRFVVQCYAPCTKSIYAHESSAELFTEPVRRGPDRQVFRPRQSLAAQPMQPNCFRVMSYNVLFDGYTTTEQATQTLFPYAKEEFMKEMYRMQLVFQEIAESHAQIVCLQEMGAHVFGNYFQPMVQKLGYQGFYANKTGTTQEGCAILVQNKHFEVMEERVLQLSPLVLASQDPIIQQFVKEYREIRFAFERIPSIAQLSVLRCTKQPSRAVIVANTHLFYREDAHIIRLIQTAVLVREMEHLKQRLESNRDLALDQVGVILAGDLNAFPQTDAVHFLSKGRASKQQSAWAQAHSFQWKRTVHTNQETTNTHKPKQVKVLPGTLAHSLDFESACGIPEFTNFASTFIGTLDYIWIGRSTLHVDQIFPFFTKEQVAQEVALPSSQFPSDHISLLCDVAWN